MSFLFKLAEMLGWMKQDIFRKSSCVCCSHGGPLGSLLTETSVTQNPSETDHQIISLAVNTSVILEVLPTSGASSDEQRFSSFKEEPATPKVVVSSPPSTPTQGLKQLPPAIPGPSTPGALSEERNLKYSPPIEDPTENPFLDTPTPTTTPSGGSKPPIPTTPSPRPQVVTRNTDGSAAKKSTDPPASPKPKPPFPIRGETFGLPGLEVSVTKRCSGWVETDKTFCNAKVPLQLKEVLALKEHGEPIEAFCGKHRKEGERVAKGGTSLKSEFDRCREWIPKYIKNEQDQCSFLKAMVQPPTDKDEAGHIYIYDMAVTENGTISLKVGGTQKDPEDRLAEWRKTCGLFSDAALLYPPKQDSQSTSKAPVAWWRKAERLVHLEVKYLVQSGAYLQAGWPNILEGDHDTVTTPPKRKKIKGAKCSHCKVTHTEIYTLEKLEGGQEWERFLLPIIERWIKFVNTLAEETERSE